LSLPCYHHVDEDCQLQLSTEQLPRHLALPSHVFSRHMHTQVAKT